MDSPVILFDGVCGLCDRWVSFVLERDKRSAFRFAALQSEAGGALLRSHGLPADQLDSVVLIVGGRAYLKSAAILEILKRLGFPWSLASAGAAVPGGLRDALYDFVATNRYRWFGRTETCRLPTPAERSRFLA
jgi:predicted DCC family thiol-disulfide oxidoreductase YuxK